MIKSNDFFDDKINSITGTLTVIVELENSSESIGMVKRAQERWKTSIKTYVKTDDFLRTPNEMKRIIEDIIQKSEGYDWWTERHGKFRELAILTLTKYGEIYPDQKIETRQWEPDYMRYLGLS